MGEIGSAVSGLQSAETMGKVNIAMLKKTEDLVEGQMQELLSSLPKPKSMQAGQNFDQYA